MKLSQELITKTIETQNTDLMPTFAIVKDNVKNLIDKSVKTVFIAVTEPNSRSSLKINRNEAMQLISLFSMVPYGECKGGAVYDTTDMKYRKKYHGHAVGDINV